MPPAPPYRYLLVDVDGTMLDHQGRLSERTRTALHRAVAAGMTLVLATGRTAHSLGRITAGLDLPPFHQITNGGAVASTPGGAEVRHAVYLEPAQWRAVVRDLEGEGLAPLVYSHHHPEPPRFHVGPLTGDPHHAAYVERNRPLCREEAVLAAAEIPRVVQVAALGRSEAFAQASARVRTRHSSALRCHTMVLHIAGAWGRITEFFAPGATKWTAFAALFPHAAADPAQVIAVGDEINDVEMIRAAGLGIAMGDAVPAVREAARRVTADAAHDGLAQALEAVLDGAD